MARVWELTPTREMTKTNWSRFTAYTLIATAALCFSKAGYIQVKAITAQWLISAAWAKTLNNPSSINRPWPWADTWPVAKLDVPALGIQLLVLDGVHGQSLAFGPGRQMIRQATENGSRTDLPENSGIQLIAGHNDTHFQFLKNLKAGNSVRLQNTFGGWQTYTVLRVATAKVQEGELRLPAEDVNSDDLFLMTCYSPLQAVLPTQKRLLAQLRPVLKKIN